MRSSNALPITVSPSSRQNFVVKHTLSPIFTRRCASALSFAPISMKSSPCGAGRLRVHNVAHTVRQHAVCDYMHVFRRRALVVNVYRHLRALSERRVRKVRKGHLRARDRFAAHERGDRTAAQAVALNGVPDGLVREYARKPVVEHDIALSRCGIHGLALVREPPVQLLELSVKAVNIGKTVREQAAPAVMHRELNGSCPPGGLEMSVVLEEYARHFVYPTPFEPHLSNAHLARCAADVHGFARDTFPAEGYAPLLTEFAGYMLGLIFA